MPQTRPTSIMVIAILHFAFGGLGILGGICGGGFLLAGGNKMFAQPGAAKPQGGGLENFQEKMENYTADKLPSSKPVQYGSMGVELLISALMIISGIGLLKMQSWGRMLSVIYAILSILSKIFTFFYSVLFSIPVAQEFLNTVAPKGDQEAMVVNLTKSLVYLAAILPIVYMIYPIIVLVIMFRPKIVAAFRGEAVLPAEEDVDDRYEEDERWGR